MINDKTKKNICGFKRTKRDSMDTMDMYSNLNYSIVNMTHRIERKRRERHSSKERTSKTIY